jgi:hypothetical protein
LEKTCPRATLPTTNPTWPDLGSNPGRRGGKRATNSLSYGTACHDQLTLIRSILQKIYFVINKRFYTLNTKIFKIIAHTAVNQRARNKQ